MTSLAEKTARRLPGIVSALLGLPMLLGFSPCNASPEPIEDEFALRTEQLSKTSSSVRAAVPINDGLFDTTAIASLDSPTGSFIRLESALSVAFDDSSKRLRIGDAVSNPGTLGSAVRFAGLQVGTPSASRSDLLDASRLALTGTAVVPTTVDAMLAGKSKTTDKFAERGLTLQKVPQVTQEKGVSFAAKDRAGRTKSFTNALLPKFAAPTSGCENFSVGLGRARVDYALASNNYGSLFANSTVTCALGSGLAMEAHGEYFGGEKGRGEKGEGENGIAGLSVFRTLGVLGTASVSFATSENSNGSGWLMRAGLQHSNDRFDFNLRAHVQSPEYREVGAAIKGDSVEQRLVASAGAQLTDRSVLSLAYIGQTTYGLAQTKTLAIGNQIDLGAKGAISVAAHRAIDSTKTGDSSMTVSYSKKLKK